MTFSNFFANITGVFSDRYFENIGIGYRRLRYNGIVISPTPLIAYDGVQANSDLSFQLSSPEQLYTYSISIPKDVLVSNLGADASAAIAPDALWEISEGDGNWQEVRVSGEPDVDLVRYSFTLIGQGIGEY